MLAVSAMNNLLSEYQLKSLIGATLVASNLSVDYSIKKALVLKNLQAKLSVMTYKHNLLS